MRAGFDAVKSNSRIALALMLEAKSGARISDILKLKRTDFDSFELNDNRFSVENGEIFIIPRNIYEYVDGYCEKNNIAYNDYIFLPLTVRAVQKHLKIVCGYLGYDGISTHSFRKYFAKDIYMRNNRNINKVRERLQHSSLKTTEKYIGVKSMPADSITRKYMSYSVEDKEKAVEYKLSGYTISETSEKFKIPLSTLKRWLKQKKDSGHLKRKVRSDINLVNINSIRKYLRRNPDIESNTSEFARIFRVNENDVKYLLLKATDGRRKKKARV